MRVLVVPEVYRLDDLSSNGTVNDAVAWAEQWLALDDHCHLYWLLPPRSTTDYAAADVLADRRRVTLIEAEPFADPEEPWSMFTEGGYSRAQLRALREAIFDAGAYVDAVVDQYRTGRFTLSKWLAEHAEAWAAQVDPVDVIACVHDLQVPFKYRYCSYRQPFQMYAELAGVAFADGAWFHADVDAAAFERYAGAVFRPRVVDRVRAESCRAGSPLDLSSLTERYADRPRYLHVAGSLWEKKHTDLVMAVAERLHEEFGIETIATSMESIPSTYADRSFVEAHPEASRETYERALRRGDLAVTASEYETMARTPFEQAASGQVLCLRDEPWIDDCVPEDYAFVGDPDDLADVAARAVRNWDEAVAENRRLVEHVRKVRSPERCGRRTYEDLRDRVRRKRDRYAFDEHAATVAAALADREEWSRHGARSDPDGPTSPDGGVPSDERPGPDEPVPLDALVSATAAHTESGRPITDLEDVALADVVYALRALGYRDTGAPGTPAFERVG